MIIPIEERVKILVAVIGNFGPGEVIHFHRIDNAYKSSIKLLEWPSSPQPGEFSDKQ